jgi:hypothetical protein
MTSSYPVVTKAEHLQTEYRMNGEKGRTRVRKRLWEIVKRVWEFVRFYSHMASTPAPDSYYSTPTSLSANEIALCWAVLTFASTGRFRFLHYVMRTWSLFECTCIYMCMCVFGLVRTEQILKIIIFSKHNCF